MGIKFEFFEAGCGDSILVTIDKKYHLLIDGGLVKTYNKKIKPRLSNIDNLDLIVLTHVHNDHICGLISLLRDNKEREKVKRIWFNSPDNARVEINTTDKISYKAGNLFNELIKKYDISHDKNIHFEGKHIYDDIIPNIELILLSPTKDGLDNLKEEWKSKKDITFCNGRVPTKINGSSCDEIDKNIDRLAENFSFSYLGDIENDSSIAFILKYQEKLFLFLGDADIRVINESLEKLGYSSKKPLIAEFVKLSHHGSHNNINKNFLELVHSQRFVILTDGSKHGHPDKDSLALILKYPKTKKDVQFIFNYTETATNKFTRDELNKHLFSVSTKLVWEF
jgi:beta-lactamase superfamily II metal-dependent hydrolase